jgi:hypothetical protein
MIKKILIFSLTFFSVLIFINFLIVTPSSAADQGGGGTTPATDKAVSLNNPLTGNKTSTDINVLIGQIINGALGLVGSLALLMFIYGGFTWMLAAGNAQNVQKGKDILLWAVIGLIVIFSAYALVHFLFTNVLTQTAATTQTQ